jgi:RNA polymerase sigma factor (TIGR02999 family)
MSTSKPDPESAPGLLLAARQGDGDAQAALGGLAYEELRLLARRMLAHERPDHSLQPTILVHETWLRLFGSRPARPEERTHFLALAAGVMRRVLVDHARRRHAVKRDGARTRVELAPELLSRPDPLADVLEVDEALQRLAALSERQARIVELRFFGGLEMTEVAEHLALSLSTVEREWRVARAFLQVELGQAT